MRVLVCGDRYWENADSIRRELSELLPGTVIIHGGARGADQIAGGVAEELGFAVEVYPAEWHRYGRAAGPIRNRRMLDEGRPEQVIAFHANLTASRGTRDMVVHATAAGIPVRLVVE